MTGAPPPLAANAPPHLWFLDTGAVGESSAGERWAARLDPHEKLRYSTLGNAEAKLQYLATRVLARTALAHYTGQPAERLRFRGARGERPELESPAMPGLSFSLAKTRGLAVALFALERGVGVDVELVAPVEAVDPLELAGHHLSPRELAELSTLEEGARWRRFYELWTLREAYLKARGVGLTLPLDQLDFRPAAAGSADAEFGPAIGDDPSRWQFALHRLGDRHLAATCMERLSAGAATGIVQVDARSLIGAPPP